MNKDGPVIIIEDDADDQEILREIFEKLKYPNELIFFFDGHEALKYLDKPTTLPFIILSDINMPKLSGRATGSPPCGRSPDARDTGDSRTPAPGRCSSAATPACRTTRTTPASNSD